MQDRFLSWQETKDPYCTHSLTQNSCKCSTLYSKMKSKDKDRIQNNIDHSTNHGRHHADLRKSLCRDKGIHSHHDQNKNTSENINPCIIHSIRKCLITCTKQRQQLWCKCKKQHSQSNCHKQENHKTVSKNLFRCLIVFFPHGNRSARSTSGSCKHSTGIDQHQDRCKQSDTR